MTVKSDNADEHYGAVPSTPGPIPENARAAMKTDNMLSQFLSPKSGLQQHRYNLYKNDHFKLIRVVYQNDDVCMTRVVPAENDNVLEDVKKRGYNVVSHMWGPEEELVKWSNSGIVDEQGEDVPTPFIRNGKQETIMNMFKNYPGYWWIELFCADTERTPRGIMGDIYKFSNQCFTLLDCTNDSIQQLATRQEMLQKWNEQVHPKTIDANAIATYYDDTTFLGDMDWKRAMRFIFGPDQAFADALSDVMDSRFFRRVCTLQEGVLPSTVLLLAEMGWDGSTTLDMALLRGVTRWICTSLPATRSSIESEAIDNHLQRITNMADEIDLIWNLKEYALQGLPDRELLKNVLSDFRRSGRKCAHARDYVHGVIGMLQIHLPMSDNCAEVWEGFREELQRRQIHVNSRFDFSDATHMGWVYDRIEFIDDH